MDIDQELIPLFQLIDNDTIKQLFEMTPALVGAFSYTIDDEPEISLSLFKTTILLKNQNK